MQVGSQWRVGFGGPYALDYGPLFTRLDRMQLTPDRWEEMFDDVRHIEAAALAAMRTR